MDLAEEVEGVHDQSLRQWVLAFKEAFRWKGRWETGSSEGHSSRKVGGNGRRLEGGGTVNVAASETEVRVPFRSKHLSFSSATIK